MMAGYNGLHDMTAILFGTTACPNKDKSTKIQSEFTQTIKRDLLIAKHAASLRGLRQSFNWFVTFSYS